MYRMNPPLLVMLLCGCTVYLTWSGCAVRKVEYSIILSEASLWDNAPSVLHSCGGPLIASDML